MTFAMIIKILAISYLIGSFPTAYVIGRLRGINIFEIGSGNMGANNTARALGIQWGVVVFFLDGVKGMVALLVAALVAPNEAHASVYVLSAIAVVLGHNWSIFATIMTGKIRGGKGAATASGTWILLVPPLMIAGVLMLWAAIVFGTRYMSLAVLTAVAVISLGMVALVLFDLAEPVYVGYMLVAAMVFYRHRTNIKALLNGTERRFGDRAKLS